jgi:hypothetical protein
MEPSICSVPPLASILIVPLLSNVTNESSNGPIEASGTCRIGFMGRERELLHHVVVGAPELSLQGFTLLGVC